LTVVAIVATNRRNGTVEKMTLQFLTGAQESGHQTLHINLYDYDIKHCIGCWACVKTNKCVLKDDFQKIFDQIKDVDVILIGTPCYWGNVPGILKTFIDRHTSCAMYKPPMASEFSSMRTMQKIKALRREMSKFGPPKTLVGKRFVLAIALTDPFPVSHTSGDYPHTLKALKTYIHNLKGKRPKVIRYTDTLFRFRKRKEEKILRKAYRAGVSL
jgi:multimeric flavodoxin WrbA